MNILISPEAAAWFKRELSLQEGAYIRLFPRYSSGGACIPASHWVLPPSSLDVLLYSSGKAA